MCLWCACVCVCVWVCVVSTRMGCVVVWEWCGRVLSFVLLPLAFHVAKATSDHGGVGKCYVWTAATAAAAPAMTRAACCTGVVMLPGEPQDDSSKCAVEPHHSHFVLAPSNDWGGETTTLFTLAKALTLSRLSVVRADPRARPMAAVLANGGFISKQEVRGRVLLRPLCFCFGSAARACVSHA